MPEIKLKHVVSCSSEDKQFPADNLLATESFKKWKCKPGEKQASIILQFDQSSSIQSVDVGNEGSAFVEMLVGRSADKEENYEVLLISQSFLSPVESRLENNFNRVRIFAREQLEKNALDQKWDRLKIVCTQPYNKNVGYGLSFLRVHAPSDKPSGSGKSTTGNTSFGGFKIKSPDEEDEKSFTPGSLFKMRSKVEEVKEAKESIPGTIKTATSEYLDKRKSSTNDKEDSTKNGSAESQSKGEHNVAKRREKQTKLDGKDAKQASAVRKRSTSPPKRSSTDEAKKPLERNETKKIRYVDFEKLFDGVVFVLSGFENPFRGQLRDKALKMGAQYKGDWGKGCTHLVCAFSNTPKYNQVKGKGKIVKKDWILDSYKERKRLPWKKYSFENVPKSGSDEEELFVARANDDETTGTSSSSSTKPKDVVHVGKNEKSPPSKKAKVEDNYDATTDELDTDDEIERVRAKTKAKTGITPQTSPAKTSDNPAKASTIPKPVVDEKDDLADLPNFFASMRFLLYGDFPTAERKQLNRFIVAFDGHIEQYMNANVTHVVTHNKWNDDFDEAVKENAKLVFVKPEWVLDCGRQNKLVDLSFYKIVQN